MKIFIDPKVLLKNIEEMNPGLDLTRVKAYFFDLAVSEESPNEKYEEASLLHPKTIENANFLLKQAPPLKPKPSEVKEVAEWDLRAEDDKKLEPILPPGLVGEPFQNKGRVIVKNAKHAERLARRNKMDGFEDKTGKELIESLTSKMTLKQNEDGQFVDTGGVENPGFGGDLEIG